MKTNFWARKTNSVMMVMGILFVFALTSGFASYSKAFLPHIGTNEQIDWKQYIDKRFDFSLEIPAGWDIDYRLDQPGAIGETLSFYSPAGNEGSEQIERIIITIGHYLIENDSALPLAQWTDLYEEKLDDVDAPSMATWIDQKEIKAKQWIGHQRLGETPLGPVVFTNTQNGDIVWFIWSNISHEDIEIYDHVVDTLRFGARSPKSLVEVYGDDFKSLSLRLDNQNEFTSEEALRIIDGDTPTETDSIEILGTDPAGYRLPFTGNYVITCGPQCCSSHSSLPEAIDYGLPMNTVVKSTYNGNVSFFGWKNDTYGNYLSIDHMNPSLRSHYAHLDWFSVSSLGQPVSKGQQVASSGDTGVGGAHLHFEVRTRPDPGAGQWIRTLPTTSWISGDPYSPCWGTANDYDGIATGP